MILKKTLLLILSLVFCLGACSCLNRAEKSEPVSTPSASSEINWNEEDLSKEQYFPTYDEVKELYPDKTVLVWTIEETGYERNYPFRAKEVNEYLDEKGYDFAVCFYPIRALQTDEENDFYATYVESLAKSGEPIDIVYSSFTYIEEAGSNAYHKYIYNGLFEPLDSYFETEIGRKLYEIMPAKHWDGMRVNDHIYGIDGAMHTLSDDYGYYVNAQLADKYNFDISVSIEEQIDILKQVKENERCDVFAMHPNFFSTPSYFVDIQEITSAVYFDEETQTARCTLDNKVYLNRLKLFYELKKHELFADMGMSTAKSFFIMQSHQSGAGTIYSSDTPINIEYNDNTISAIPVFNENTSVRSSYMATGICSYSKNKEKAFELLALTQIDSHLNNLLTYGIEGTDYNLSDGYVDNINNPISLDRFANKMICHPDSKLSITPKQYKEIYENAELPDSISFAFDGRDFIAESYATSDEMGSFEFVGSGNFEDAIKDLYSKLNSAGLDKLIDECNRQYEEYRQ